MRSRAPFVEKISALCLLLALAFLAGCNRSTQGGPAPAEVIAASTGERVFVEFEGPWAFVADPKDANMVIAIAPKTKAHRDLNVAASNNVNLAAGIYDLSVPAHGAPSTAALDNTFAKAKVNASSLQSAIDSKAERYVVRLPKPEAYVAAKRVRSRFGMSYPPDSSTEQNYVTAVSLRYTVNSLSGFSLSGNPDSGSFNPFLLQLDTPAIHFLIEPAQSDDPLDECSVHSRQAFHDLTTLLNLTAYVDFPEDAADCHGKDPQKATAGKPHARFKGPTSSQQLTDAVSIAEGQIVFGGIGAVPAPRLFAAVAVFLHLSGIDCKAPLVFLTTSP